MKWCLLRCMSPLMGWPGRAQRLICWTVAGRREARLKEHAMRTSQKAAGIIATIGMEACSGAHHIGRQLAAVGHDVRLIPAQYVKPFLKGHKNDYRDA